MPGKEITIDTGEGQMNTFIVHPDEDGPHPVILFGNIITKRFSKFLY